MPLRPGCCEAVRFNGGTRCLDDRTQPLGPELQRLTHWFEVLREIVVFACNGAGCMFSTALNHLVSDARFPRPVARVLRNGCVPMPSSADPVSKPEDCATGGTRPDRLTVDRRREQPGALSRTLNCIAQEIGSPKAAAGACARVSSFVRTAGMVHSRRSKSISRFAAPRASPMRTPSSSSSFRAVRISAESLGAVSSACHSSRISLPASTRSSWLPGVPLLKSECRVHLRPTGGVAPVVDRAE